MQIETIEPLHAGAWDQVIAPFPDRLLFHRSPWLAFLADTQGVAPVTLRLCEAQRTCGYFVGLILKKGGFRLLGSPLSTWMTEHMGPLALAGFDWEAFLVLLDEYCGREGIHQVELGSPGLDPAFMAAHGYECRQWMTFRIPLAQDENTMWMGLTTKGRNRVRKGRKNGLAVEDVDDPAIIDLHYRQLREVFGRQGLAPPFPMETYAGLFRHLKPEKLLFCLQVRQGQQVLATGLFAHDDRTVYALSAASWKDGRRLYPNELLHWEVMRRAAALGVSNYRIGDNYRLPEHGGRFKDKFNGVHEPVYRFIKSYSLLAKYARAAYTKVSRFRGKAFRVTSRRTGGPGLQNPAGTVSPRPALKAAGKP